MQLNNNKVFWPSKQSFKVISDIGKRTVRGRDRQKKIKTTELDQNKIILYISRVYR